MHNMLHIILAGTDLHCWRWKHAYTTSLEFKLVLVGDFSSPSPLQLFPDFLGNVPSAVNTCIGCNCVHCQQHTHFRYCQMLHPEGRFILPITTTVTTATKTTRECQVCIQDLNSAIYLVTNVHLFSSVIDSNTSWVWKLKMLVSFLATTTNGLPLMGTPSTLMCNWCLPLWVGW